MKEYIERSRVINALQDIPTGCIGEPCNAGLRYARAQIAVIPAADVAPVRHGRWMVTDGYPHRLYCSVCYKTYAKNVKWIEELDLPVNYCPECGALMDGKEDNNA